jgi:hypothetical protein
MFAVWGVLIVGFTAVMVYRAHLTQHETDQLFLSDNPDLFNEPEHDEIVRRVNFIQPIVNGFGGAAALVTMLIVGVYVANALPHVRF